MGIVPVGKISMILTGLVLAPFVLIWTYSFSHSHGAPIAPTLSLKGIGLPAIGMGVITVMWNFFGWDNSTTYAGEVDKPVRSYIISFVIAFLTVIGVYLITSLAVLHSGIDFKALEEKGFPALGIQLGHPWLARLLAIGGMASMVGLFSAVLLSVSRVPKVMADDGLMPEKLNALHSRFHTPYVSIIFSALIISLMILRNFDDLIIMDVTLYGAGLFLEFISLIVLRIKYPKENRPFKIPLKTGGLILMYILSFGIYALGLAGAFLESEKTKIPAIAAVLALFSAELVWQIIVRWKLKPPEIKVKNNPRIRLKR
jgi:amino acid transporter